MNTRGFRLTHKLYGSLCLWIMPMRLKKINETVAWGKVRLLLCLCFNQSVAVANAFMEEAEKMYTGSSLPPAKCVVS